MQTARLWAVPTRRELRRQQPQEMVATVKNNQSAIEQFEEPRGPEKLAGEERAKEWLEENKNEETCVIGRKNLCSSAKPLVLPAVLLPAMLVTFGVGPLKSRRRMMFPSVNMHRLVHVPRAATLDPPCPAGLGLGVRGRVWG